MIAFALAALLLAGPLDALAEPSSVAPSPDSAAPADRLPAEAGAGATLPLGAVARIPAEKVAAPSADAGDSTAKAAPMPPAIDLRSETLTVDHRTQRAVFSGGVVVVRGDLEVRCPSLTAHYDAASRVERVDCDGPVTATQGGRTMTSSAGSFDNTSGMLHLEGETTLVEAGRRFSGESLDYETGTSLATLAKARADLPEAAEGLQGIESGPFRITAEKVIHDFTRRRTIFDGHVVANRGDLTMRATRLVLDGAEDGTIDRAWTEGGPVRVKQGDRIGTAQRGTFVAGGKRLILEGDPIVTEGSSSLRGDRVTFFVGQGRVEVAKPRAVFPLEEVQKRGRE